MTRLTITAAAVAVAALTALAYPSDASTHHTTTAAGESPAVMSLRGQVRARLVAQRQLQIKRLAAYSAKGVFPRNAVTTGLQNIFVDSAGRVCAAANLISLSGNHALVTATAKSNNFIRLVNVRKGALLDWMLQSGLTIEEIDRIQEPYMGMTEPRPDQIAAETRRLQQHFARVLAELQRNTAASVTVATDRLMRRPDLAARFVKG